MRALHSGLKLDVFPRGILQQLLIRLETRRVSLDEPPAWVSESLSGMLGLAEITAGEMVVHKAK